MEHDLYRGRNIIVGLMMIGALAFAALGALFGWGRPAIGDIADAYESPLGFLAIGAAGVLIAWRRPQNRLGLVLVAYAFVCTLSALALEYVLAAVDQSTPPLGYGMAAFLAGPLPYYMTLTLALGILLYPTGALPSRRWRWLVGLMAFSASVLLLWTILSALNGGLAFPPGRQLTQGGVWLGIFRSAGSLAMLLSLALSVVALAIRFWRNRGTERWQILWLLAPWAVMLPAILINKFVLQELLHDQVTVPGWISTMLGLLWSILMPAGIAIGVLKYPPSEREGLRQDRSVGDGGRTGGAEAIETSAVVSMPS
jgi:hypothetical protein